MPIRFDLQSHSTHSDGVLSATEVVERAANAGVELLALSDHDTISGVAEAITAGERLGVRVVSAVEISAVDAGSPVPRELHILGYNIDHTGPPMTTALVDFLADREHRTLRMRDALRDVGFDLDEAEIDSRIAEGKPIGRPHLAAAVLAAPANSERLKDEDIDDVGSLIRGYLIEGKSAFRLRETPTVAEAVVAIHDAGGVAIWAHPFWDIADPDEVLATVDRFKALDIDGIEAFYITHTKEQTELLAKRCAELGLLSTGSADFHGPENRQFSEFMAFQAVCSAWMRYASASSASSSLTFTDRLRRVSQTSSIALRSCACGAPFASSSSCARRSRAYTSSAAPSRTHSTSRSHSSDSDRPRSSVRLRARRSPRRRVSRPSRS
jgi:3',5'-nucleoside bisphosphate phosphatase